MPREPVSVVCYSQGVTARMSRILRAGISGVSIRGWHGFTRAVAGCFPGSPAHRRGVWAWFEDGVGRAGPVKLQSRLSISPRPTPADVRYLVLETECRGAFYTAGTFARMAGS